MKSYFKYFLILTLFVIYSCSKDDSPTETISNIGTHRVVVNYTGDLENTNVDFISTTSLFSVVTYLNTGEEIQPVSVFEEGERIHTFETSDDADILVVGITAITTVNTMANNHSYSMEYFFNDESQGSIQVTRNNFAVMHSYSFTLEDGIEENSIFDQEGS